MAEFRQEFQQELDAIEARVIEMFGMLAEDLTRATDALLTGNNEVVKLLAEREKTIEELYPELESLVSRAILMQAPVASDLRFLLTVLRIVPELERSHSLVEHIARRADHFLAADLSPRTRGLVERMGELASGGMSIPVTMEMTLVARFYERLGDHAVNVATRIIYLAGSQPPEKDPEEN